jgi:cysteine desulfuration protein SufE
VQTIGEVIEAFSLFDDWEDKYRVLIDLGKQVPPLPDSLKIDANLVRGCVSRVWLVPEIRDEKLFFQAGSDAQIVKGLVGLLHLLYSGKTVTEIKEIDITGVFRQLGLEQNLSPNRRNGFFAMVEKIRGIAAN